MTNQEKTETTGNTYIHTKTIRNMHRRKLRQTHANTENIKLIKQNNICIKQIPYK